jgi:hypothetical protein
VRFHDLLMSAAAIAVLVALIALADDRVRERMGGMTTGSVSHHLVNGTNQVESATSSVRELVIESGPLTILVIAGAVLFVCMFRT